MKYYDLTDEEKQLSDDFEKGELISIDKSVQKAKEYQKIAKATLNKSKNINIRLSEKDLQKVKAKAVEDGIPYQTLVSSIIHRFVNK